MNIEPPSTICPNCEIALLATTTVCPDCGEDLAALIHLQLAPYRAYNESLRLVQAGELERAIIQLHQVINDLPNEPLPYVVLAKLYSKTGNWASARQWWQSTLRRWPDQTIAHAGLALVEERAVKTHLWAQQQRAVQRRRHSVELLVSFGVGCLLVGAIILGINLTASTRLTTAPPSFRPLPTAIAIWTRAPTLTPFTLSKREPIAMITPTPAPITVAGSMTEER